MKTETLIALLAFWLTVEFMFWVYTRFSLYPLFITINLIKSLLKKILGKKACSISLHKEKIFREKHTFELEGDKYHTRESGSTVDIYVNQCEHCERRLISFYHPGSNLFNGWHARNIAKGQHLKMKKAY